MTLIKRLSLFITLSISLFSVSSFAQDFSDEAIANRIAPISDVYIDGEIVTANTASASDEPAEPRTGEQVYGTFCIACHGTGAAGAPIKGDAAAWGPRIAQGEETLIKHALSGFNAMPAKGTCSNCSDDEIIATVKFLTQGL
ncbi:cytochrome c5 family protein [Psychromonas sp. SP041]|uniref:c-type cytochrome n=1 Tax=Psychromonas sp. SP041 TaxID=1365007 RepID=UPI0010C78ED3|nr:cytochrome c5 family protein [Psychromonas sp. SP041]